MIIQKARFGGNKHMPKPLTCIVCDYQPVEAIKHSDNNFPYKATAFITRGHYGSTFFDPMDGSHIEINVCDECLVKAQAKGQILNNK